MKKPVNDYETTYPAEKSESESYYGNCETINDVVCNFNVVYCYADNYGGNTGSSWN